MRNVAAHVPRGRLGRALPLRDVHDKLMVQYYKWDTNVKSSHAWMNMKKIVMIVPRSLVNDVKMFAYRCPDHKFIPIELINVCASLARKIIVKLIIILSLNYRPTKINYQSSPRHIPNSTPSHYDAPYPRLCLSISLFSIIARSNSDSDPSFSQYLLNRPRIPVFPQFFQIQHQNHSTLTQDIFDPVINAIYQKSEFLLRRSLQFYQKQHMPVPQGMWHVSC